MRYGNFLRVIMMLIALAGLHVEGLSKLEDPSVSKPPANLPDRYLELAQHAASRHVKDSLVIMAHDAAVMAGDEEVLMNFFMRFFSIDSSYESPHAVSFAKQMHQLARRANNDIWLWNAHATTAQIHLLDFAFEDALNDAERAYYFASQTGKPKDEMEAHLLLGTCLERKDRRIEAFRHYLDAMHLAERQGDSTLLARCYERLSYFYLLIEHYEKAKIYKIKQISLLAPSSAIDSTKLMQRNIELASIMFYNGEDVAADRLLRRVLDFNERHESPQLRRDVFVIYRSTLVTNGKLRELADLYVNKYPEELARISLADTTLFYRLSAFIYEANEKNDSAQAFYQLAESRLLKGNLEPYSVSTFYKRYGQFLFRTGQVALAEEKLTLAYEYAAKVQYLPFMIENAGLLDSANYLLGNPAKAHYYAKLTGNLKDRMASAAKQDELLLLEIDNETKKREFMQQREQEATRRRHNLQYMGLALGIITSFVILAMLGSFKVNRWLIKAMGFFAFIFFFEFIILLADHEIHHATHGEPWKIMAVKVVLIGVLLPLHHWLEHKVVHYLSNHALIDTSRFFSLKRLTGKPKLATQANKEPVAGDKA